MPGSENINPDPLPAAKAPKLRSSCEGCGNAKVKCDRGQPKCSRCATLQLTCVYGISLKHGKPPRKRPISCLDTQNSLTPKKRAGRVTRTVESAENHMTMGLEQSLDINKPPRLVPMTDTPLSFSLDSTKSIQRHDESSANARRSQTSKEAGQLKSPDPATGNLSAASNTNISSSINGSTQHGPTFFNPFTIDEWPQFDIWGLGPEFSPYLNDARLSASALEPLNNHSATFDSPEVHSCPRGSYELFRDLICPSPFLHAPEANVDTVSARLDEVLHFNSQAIDRLRQLLKCPCAKSGHRIMVHASIISRILIWYQQAAGWTNISAWESGPGATTASPSLDSASSSSSSSSSSGAATDNETTNPPTLVQSTGFAVAQVPVSMGTFNVEDENMQDIFRNQLVLSELKKAANVIDLFASQQPGECSATGVASLYSHLGVWLRSEHLRTAGMLKARLSALNKTLDC